VTKTMGERMVGEGIVDLHYHKRFPLDTSGEILGLEVQENMKEKGKKYGVDIPW